MSSIQSLRALLVDELQDLYHAENQLLKALPKMSEAATNEELREGFTLHLQQTQNHVARLEKCFELLSEETKGKTCHAMEGLIKEGEEAISDRAPGAIKDAKLIGAAQRVEHYEMAGYGTARAFAEVLEEDEVADLLQETLDEEGDTNKKLTEIAGTVNEEAFANNSSER